MHEDIKLPKDLIWSNEEGYYKAKVNGYELCVTNNGIKLWWGVQLGEEAIDSSFRKENNLYWRRCSKVHGNLYSPQCAIHCRCIAFCQRYEQTSRNET